MAKLNFTPPDPNVDVEGFRGYFLVQDGSGELRCSCGSELEQLDDDTWVCAGGYPEYRPEKGEIRHDKFGRTYLKLKPHNKGGRENG